MRITKCDLCKKKIKDEPIRAGIGLFPKAELCEKCGAPILRFLRRHRFVEPKAKKKNK